MALKRQGRNWIGLCPFHDDRKTPNLIVTPGKGLWRCMAGHCGAAGNAIQFLQRHDGLGFRHAFEVLANGGKAAFGTNGHNGCGTAKGGRPEGSASIRKSTVPKLPCPLGEESEGSVLLEEVAVYYHERLARNPSALEYLKRRGLDDGGLVKQFRVGFADRTLGLRVPRANRVGGKKLRERLKTAGIYRDNGREHLNGCLTVPVPGMEGDLVQMYGRRIDPKAPKEGRHLYLSRPLAGVFNPEAFKEREIILCEGILDAMTFYVHGMEAVTCTFGTANFSHELLEAIKACKTESVRLAFDGDGAGEKAAAMAAAKLGALGIECHRVRFPWGSDANSFALHQGGGALRRAVRSAEWLGDVVPPVSKATPAPASFSLAAEAAKKAAGKAAKGKTIGGHSCPLAVPEAACDAARKEESPSVPPAPAVPRNPEGEEKSKEAAKGKEHSSANGIPTGVPQLERKGESLEAAFGERVYRVGGLEKNRSLDTLRVTLRVSCGGLMHVDSLDLYRDGERRKFVERAAEETLLEKELLKRDLGKLLLLLEEEQEARLAEPEAGEEPVELSPGEREEALAFLGKPGLLRRIAAAYARAGVVGEGNNLLAAYLACTSRKLEKPLAVIIQSTSAAGKSALMEAVLSFFPKEEKVQYSAMTGQSLYYLGEKDLKHKVLAIAEEEGAEKASYALKLLQSEQSLRIASTGKDPKSGRMETQEYRVEGPCAIILTTTSIDIDEELMNRCLVLTVDESREQTERIHAMQRKSRTLEGLRMRKEREKTLGLMRNVQRLIRPVEVITPWGDELTFTAERTRTRRDHEKYLDLISSVTLLHQYQRPLEHDEVAGEHIKSTLGDIEAANAIAPEVLGRSLDELPPQTRRLLESVKELVRDRMKEEQLEQRLVRFSRKELREFTGWSQMQVRRHLEKLLDLEYLAIRGGRNGVALKHELLVEATRKGGSYHIGLIDVEKLRRKGRKK